MAYVCRFPADVTVLVTEMEWPDQHIIISMPGPELADLMLTKDGKILDNCNWKVPYKYLPCWVYPLVGARKTKSSSKLSASTGE